MKKNTLVLIVTSLWAVLSALNESGLMDLLPFDNESLNKWMKWVVAFIVVVVNAIYFNPKNRTGGTIPPDDDEPKK